MVKKDFPEKGDVSFVQKSLPAHPECPVIRGKVRAQMNIVGTVYRPVRKNGLLTGQTDVFMVTSIDIKGLVPKIFVNNASASIPRENFAEFQDAAIAMSKGTFEKRYCKKTHQ